MSYSALQCTALYYIVLHGMLHFVFGRVHRIIIVQVVYDLSVKLYQCVVS